MLIQAVALEMEEGPQICTSARTTAIAGMAVCPSPLELDKSYTTRI
jgi:hypothetical protein